MYWTRSENNLSYTIQRANLDGTGRETLLSIGVVPRRYSVGLALDVGAGKMYWSERPTNTIQRANLDGSDHETLVTGASGETIALDVVAGKMYWTDRVGAPDSAGEPGRQRGRDSGDG